jgi:hypothetical protein
MACDLRAQSGGERAAVQALREIRGHPAVAPAFGLRRLQRRFRKEVTDAKKNGGRT